MRLETFLTLTDEYTIKTWQDDKGKILSYELFCGTHFLTLSKHLDDVLIQYVKLITGKF